MSMRSYKWMPSFLDELEKISKTIPVKGAAGRRNKDGVARIRPAPKEPAEIIAKPKGLPALPKIGRS